MAKTAIFSDIHGNIEALDTVISDARAQGVSNFACLGDIVGYGPNPADCIAMVQEIGCVCIKGNHDDDASSERDLWNLSDVAKESLEWTRERLTQSQKDWLAALPYQKRLGRNLLVHATIDEPETWQYVSNKFDAEIALSRQKVPVCFFGHTHVPVCYQADGLSVTKVSGQDITLAKASRYLVNVGSVGQPRDGIPKACYVIFDSTSGEISFRRLDYNIECVIKGLSEAGLSSDLAQRLEEAA